MFIASENDDEHNPIPIAKKSFYEFNFKSGRNLTFVLTCNNTVSDDEVSETIRPRCRNESTREQSSA